MDGTVFAANPHSAHQRRGEAHKPTVGVVVGRTCFAAHGCLDSIPVANSYARAMIHHIAQHIDHLVGSGLTDYLVRLGCEGSNDIAVAIFDTSNIERLCANTLVGKCRVSIHHLLHAHLARPQAQTYNGVELSLNTKGLHHFDQLLGREVRHQVSRYPVGRILQAPCDGDCITPILGVGVTRRPWLAIGVV